MLSAQRLKNKILRDRYNSIIFKANRGGELYLVGGYVRDILRGVHSTDRDYIVSDDIKNFVNKIKETIKGSVIEFKRGGTIRIALNDGVTFDFSRPMGTLKEDLSKRDFTLNSLAWSPNTGIIDPFKGLKDIKNRRIRTLSGKNLTADPLRMLRAYRFASEFNGSIEERTRKAIKMFHNRIKQVSPERITFELFNLLNSENPVKYLKMALYDRLLKDILFISDKKLEHNIKAISRLEVKLDKLSLKVKVQLEQIFSQNLTYKGLLRLVLLFRQNGSMPLGTGLRMSNKIIKRIMITHRGLSEFKKDELFNIFLESKEAAIDILILKGRIDLLREYRRFNNIWKKGYLSSSEIERIANIRGGPRLGKAIIELRRAQFEKKIKDKRDAKKFLSNILDDISTKGP
jgi:tRNA nucleotidyltransferase/poly(A) polymerase